MKITDLLDPRSISLDAAPTSKSETLDKAVELMAASGKLSDVEAFRKQVYAREEESTTGIGEGIAIPHGKCDAVKKPGLAAMQTLFPVLRQTYGVEVRSIPRPTAPDKPLTAQEQKKRSHANWWYYNWGIVAVAAMVIVGVAYVAHGLLTTVDPDYTVAVVTAEALPDEAVQHLQIALADYAEDANGDGAVVVQVNNYTWSADAALTDMNGQMAGATQMNTDLSSGESKIWILDDPEGFEQAYGALSEKLGADWQTKLIPWSDLPALSALELGSYATAADGSQTVDVQSRFAGYSVAVFDFSDELWQALNS
jgi:hypothetical protein